MTVTQQDVIDNASEIAQLINAAPADVDINALPEETSWADTDYAHIQKSGVDSKIEKQNMDIAGTDADAIHDNVAGEINAITSKGTPIAADKLIIEDSAASWAKKSILLTDLLASGDAISSTKSDNYTILDTDAARAFYLSGAAANKIFTLPTLADNLDKELLFINLDSTYELQIKGEGSENISHLGITQNTIDIELQGSGFSCKATSAGWEVTKIIGAELSSINSVLEMIYTKYFLGTTDADSKTDVAHGVVAANILNVIANIYDGTLYRVAELYAGISANISFQVYYNATNISMDGVGANVQSKAYKIKMDYYI